MKTFFTAVLAAALLHITPTVVLVKRPDAVSQLLPGADQFFAREVHLSAADAHRLHEALEWSPSDGVLTFYTGRRAATDVGVLTFVRVDTPHGPVEVAVSFGSDRAIRGVVVTKATVETKPWVLEALKAGLTDQYRGVKRGGPAAGATTITPRVGQMAAYIAKEIDKGVARALVSYDEFFAKEAGAKPASADGPRPR
jgi:hypothetical protein